MVTFIISLILSLASASSDGITTTKKDMTKATVTTTSATVTTYGGTSTWGNGTD